MKMAWDNNEMRAFMLGGHHGHSGMNPIFTGFVAGCRHNAARSVVADSYRLASQFGIVSLLHTGKESIHVNMYDFPQFHFAKVRKKYYLCKIKHNKRMMVRLFFAFLLLMATGTTKAQLAQLDLDAKYATELVKPGTMAPDFKLKTPQGKTLKLSKVMKGKYTLIDFWASWCGDCRKDMPNVHRLYRKFAPLGVQFVGISFDTEAANWQAAIEKYGIAYTQLSELKKMSESDVARQYGVKWIPSMVLVDPEGKVVLSTVLSDKMEKTMMTICIMR